MPCPPSGISCFSTEEYRAYLFKGALGKDDDLAAAFLAKREQLALLFILTKDCIFYAAAADGLAAKLCALAKIESRLFSALFLLKGGKKLDE